MNIKVTLTLFLGLLAGTISAQLKSVITTKENEVLKHFSSFCVVDQATGYAMGKATKKYIPGKVMPQVYFTKAPTDLINLKKTVVSINDAHDTENGFWSLFFDEKKKLTTFGRRRFVTNKQKALWIPIIDDNLVIFKAIISDNYILINKTGQYELTPDIEKASRWELIYTKN